MADAITATYKFTLPEVGASDDTWGLKLNGNWSHIETLLKSGFTGGTEDSLGKLKAANMPTTGINDVIFSGNPAITIDNANAQIRMIETDQVDPLGRYRISLSGGNFNIQRANAAEWASFVTLFGYDRADNQITIGPKIQFSDQVRPSDFYQPTIKSDTNVEGSAFMTFALDRPWRITQRGGGVSSDMDLHYMNPGDTSLRIMDHVRTSGIRLQAAARKLSGVGGALDIADGTVVNNDRSVTWPSFGIRRVDGTSGATFAMSGTGAAADGWGLTMRPAADGNEWQIRWQSGSPNISFHTDGTVDGSKITGLPIAFLRNDTGSNINHGATVAGAGLRYANGAGGVQGPAPSGNWMCLGFASGTGADDAKTSLFIKDFA